MATPKLSEVMPLRITHPMLRFIKAESQKEFITTAQFMRKLIREAMERAQASK